VAVFLGLMRAVWPRVLRDQVEFIGLMLKRGATQG
jgi:hypothetical protein